MQKKGRNSKKRQKMHVQFQNSCKKGQKCKKKAENAFQFENSKDKNGNKKANMQKKGKNGKKKAHLFGFFSLLYPLCIFLHFKPKNSYKKWQKCKKKAWKFFQIAKNKHAKKKHEITFQKKMQKKA